jgi:acylpyruvate hydrolase
MIRSIWAVGRNYADHIKEMGAPMPAPAGDQPPEPMIFLKAGSTVVANGRTIRMPTFSRELHHECELAVRLVVADDGSLHVDAFTIALDLTARDLQATAKAKGQPWTLAKSFTDSCPLGDWVPLNRLTRAGEGPTDDAFAPLQNLELVLRVNGEQRQHGFTKDMLFSVRQVCEFLISRFPVQTGDVLLTGTPAGVGPLNHGDHVEAEIVGFTRASWTLANP